MRILIIEDEPELLRGLAMALREEDYAVDTAADGEDGLFKAVTWDYDAIVLDLMIPRVSGMEVLRRLREQKPTPVLILSARDAIEDRVGGLDTGADDYLVKPFQLEELYARLRALLRRSVGEASSKIEIGAYTVDTASRQIWRGTADQSQELIELTAREYRLAELLVSNRGKIVTRTMIYDHLFDEQHDSMSNIVDVYISRLRSKLGRTFVRTRRGEGYILDA